LILKRRISNKINLVKWTMLTEDPKSLEDALKMINIQHVKIGNTW
jgi:hypothetical protein